MLSLICYFQHFCEHLPLLTDFKLAGQGADIVSYLPPALHILPVANNVKNISNIIFTGISAHLPHPNATAPLGPLYSCQVGNHCSPDIVGRLFAVNLAKDSARSARSLCHQAALADGYVDLPDVIEQEGELLVCSEIDDKFFVAGILLITAVPFPPAPATGCLFGAPCILQIPDYGLVESERLEIVGTSGVFKASEDFTFNLGLISKSHVGQRLPLRWSDGETLTEDLGELEIAGVFPGSFTCGLGSTCQLNFNATVSLTEELSSFISIEPEDCAGGPTGALFEGKGNNFTITISDSSRTLFALCWSAQRTTLRIPAGAVELGPPTLLSAKLCSLGENCVLTLDSNEATLQNVDIWPQLANSVDCKQPDADQVRQFHGVFPQGHNPQKVNQTVSLGRVGRIVPEASRNFRVCFQKDAVVGSLGDFTLEGPMFIKFTCFQHADCWMDLTDLAGDLSPGFVVTSSSERCSNSDHRPFRGVSAEPLETASWLDGTRYYLGRAAESGNLFVCWRQAPDSEFKNFGGVVAQLSIIDSLVDRGCWSMADDSRAVAVTSSAECNTICSHSLFGLNVGSDNSTYCRCLAKQFPAVTRMDSADCSARCSGDGVSCGSAESTRLVSVYAPAVHAEPRKTVRLQYGNYRNEIQTIRNYSYVSALPSCSQDPADNPYILSPEMMTIQIFGAANATNVSESAIILDGVRVAYHPGNEYRGVSLALVDIVTAHVVNHFFYPADSNGTVDVVALETASREATELQVTLLVSHGVVFRPSDHFTARLLRNLGLPLGNASAISAISGIARNGVSLAGTVTTNTSGVIDLVLPLAREPAVGCIANDNTGETRAADAFLLQGPSKNQTITCIAGEPCEFRIRGVSLILPNDSPLFFFGEDCEDPNHSEIRALQVANLDQGFYATYDLGIFKTRSNSISRICFAYEMDSEFEDIGSFRVIAPFAKRDILVCTVGNACEFSFRSDYPLSESVVYLNPLGDCKAQVGLRVALKRQEQDKLLFAISPERSADLFGDFALCWTSRKSVPAVVHLGTLTMEEAEEYLDL